MDFEVTKIEQGNWSMECIRFGTGRKNLVIFPGISMKRMADSAGSIAKNYDLFSKEYTVYLLDRRSPVPNGYSIAEMAEDSVKILQKIGLSSFSIFGASQGGAIAQIIAGNHPELVEKLVLGSTIAKSTPQSDSVLENWAKLSDSGDFIALQHDIFTHTFSDSFYRKNARAFALLEQLGSAEECARFSILSKACCGFDCTESTAKISCPVLVIYGQEDKMFSLSQSMEIAHLTDGRLLVIPNAGHAAYDESPVYKPQIKSFLDK